MDAPQGTMEVKGERLCAGQVCASAEQCCLLTGECFDPKLSGCALEDEPAMPPAGTRSAPAGATWCASNADCAADEYCDNETLCLGIGYCASRTNCGTSTGRAFCGCDGITYPNRQSACFAGARIAGEGTCGEPFEEGGGGSFAGTLVTTCTSDEGCSTGQHCCALTGRCIADGRDAVCVLPPEGSDRACLDASDCLQDDVCLGEGCEGPGGCVSRSRQDCTGILQPVCGCDGNSYTSAACALQAGVRVASTGQCMADSTP